MVIQTLKPGYKQTEIGIIPEDWEAKKLSELTTLMTNGFVGIATIHYTDSNDGITYIQGFNVEENSFNFTGIKKVSVDFHKQHLRSCLQEGDVLTIQTGEIGLTTIVPKELVGANCHALIISRFKKDLSPKFFSYYLNSFKGRNRLRLIETGTTMKHINVGDMIHFYVPVPPTKSEQSAIARFLSDVDALIESLDKLITKKKNIKQGAMQELLTGKKRLPGFKEEWKEKRLGEIVDIKKGQLITDSTRKIGLIPVIAGGKTPAYYHNKANRFGKTITVSSSGASAGFIAYHDYPIFASDCSTIEESKKYYIQYIYFLLQLNQEKIYKLQTGGAQPHIHPRDLIPIIVLIPKIEEQAVITKVLSDMDAEIEELEEKRDKYKLLKVGLMQVLLTGEIRLI